MLIPGLKTKHAFLKKFLLN